MREDSQEYADVVIDYKMGQIDADTGAERITGILCRGAARACFFLKIYANMLRNTDVEIIRNNQNILAEYETLLARNFQKPRLAERAEREIGFDLSPVVKNAYKAASGLAVGLLEKDGGPFVRSMLAPFDGAAWERARVVWWEYSRAFQKLAEFFWDRGGTAGETFREHIEKMAGRKLEDIFGFAKEGEGKGNADGV